MFGKPAKIDRAAVTYFKKTHTMYYLDDKGRVSNLDLRDLKIDKKCLVFLEQLTGLKKVSFQGNNISDFVLKRVSTIKSLEEIDLRSCQKLTDNGFHYLKEITNLKRLQLYDTAISDTGLSYLTSLKNLEELDLNATPISDAGMGLLKEFPNLKNLSIGGVTNITDAGLQNLSYLTKLEVLDIRDGSFSNEGLTPIKDLMNLKRFYAAGTQITGRGLKNLAKFVNLEELFLEEPQVGDDGLKYLKDLKKLRYLNLTNTAVSDKGLTHLQGLKNLRELYLESTRVTNSGKKKLKEFLPKCVIFISGVKKIDVDQFNANYFRNKPPSCISEFNHRPLFSKGIDPIFTSFGLICRCGNEAGSVLGYSLAEYNPKYQGPEIFLSPLGFSCSKCKKTTEIIDTDIHGYDGELGESATIRGQGKRKDFICPNCGNNKMRVTVEFCYGGGVLDLAEDDPDIRIEDYFDSFSADGKCTHCNKIVHIADFETA